ILSLVATGELLFTSGSFRKKTTHPLLHKRLATVLLSRLDTTMAGETEDEIPESGAVFTFGKSKFADNVPSKFWLKNDVPLNICCGDEHTALITENGKLFMFGSNNWGQLGLGSKTMVNKPTCVKALKSEKVLIAACGRNHTLVYTSQGSVYSAGGNSEGQLGLGDCEERTTFQLVDFFSSHGPIKMLAAGSNTSAALTASGRLFMWGDNTEGQIGQGKEMNALTPQEVSVGRPVAWVSCGYYHSAFVTVDGGLYTFGERDSGKLGLATGQLTGHRLPQLVKGIPDRVTQVSCGGGHTVAVTEDELYTFGLGQFGQLGHGTFLFEVRLPRSVDHFRKGRVQQVMCGENHTAVITDSGLLYTFGDGRHGKLGLGEENFTNQFKPTLCPRFLKYNVQAVACGGCHMLVLAKPRDKTCEVTLEEDDVTEDYLEKSYTELLGDTLTSATLKRSLTARVRRRERERSPEQFGLMFRTLPPLTSSYLNASLPVSSQTVPSRLSPKELSLQNGIHQHRRPRSTNTESRADEREGNAVESMTHSQSVQDLGDTTDFLNMTHVIKMDPSEKTLTLSPVQKDLEAGERDGENEDDEDDEDDEEESQVTKAQPLAGLSQSEPLEGPEHLHVGALPDSVQKDDSGETSRLALTEVSSASNTQQNGIPQDKSKIQPGTNGKLSLFKRLSFRQTDGTIKAPVEGTGVGNLPASTKGLSAGRKSRDPTETKTKTPSDPGGRAAHSATCTIL
ncbi:hypothetical protein UPYG_G00021990, partial [Umbra pygmaea]